MRTATYVLSFWLFGAALLAAAPAQACPAGYVKCGGDLCCPRP